VFESTNKKFSLYVSVNKNNNSLIYGDLFFVAGEDNPVHKPFGFVQINTNIKNLIYEKIANITNASVVVDAYAGACELSAIIAQKAKKVFAIDAGEGQLESSLALDPRVVNIEKYNARNLNKSDFEDEIDIAVMDVSFISQTLIIPALSELLSDGAYFVSLIKPQFEVGRSAVGKRGIVKNPKDRVNAVKSVVKFAEGFGFGCLGVLESVITGTDGNVEYVAAFEKGTQSKIIIDL
jgi:23S rRNA (cytidine1920-2'-O)/16S rRNA (cytidine1409-2'-O)-methyltransferase